MIETISYQKEIKAIKEHRCNFCSDKIRVGEKYTKSTHKCDGALYDWKLHKSCDAIAVELKMYEFDTDYGLTGDDFMEIISSEYYSLLLDTVPNEERKKYDEILSQIRYVAFRYKLQYVIRHYLYKNKTEKNDL